MTSPTSDAVLVGHGPEGPLPDRRRHRQGRRRARASTLERGKTLGIVGESGSGKSVSSSAILGLHHGTSAKVTGQIMLDGTDLLTLSDERDAQAAAAATSR